VTGVVVSDTTIGIVLAIIFWVAVFIIAIHDYRE